MALHWYCARCGEEVDFEDQMRFYVFDENEEPKFSVRKGLWFLAIVCPNCRAYWTLSIGPMETEWEILN